MATKSRLRWTPPLAYQIGTETLTLAKKHSSRLSARGLDQAFFTANEEAVSNLGKALGGQVTNLNLQKTRTRNQVDLLEEARSRVVAVRGALQDVHGGRKALLISFGIGNPAAVKTLANALEAIDAILLGWALHKADAEAAHVLQKDIDDLASLRAALMDSETAQKDATGDRKVGTQTLASLTRAVIAFVDRVHAAVRLEFAGDPVVVAQFLGLIPSKGKGKRKKPQPQPPVET